MGLLLNVELQSRGKLKLGEKKLPAARASDTVRYSFGSLVLK